MTSFVIRLLALTVGLAAFAKAEQFDVLVFTKTEGYRHESIPAGVEAVRQLGRQHFFNVEWTEDAAAAFTDEGLSRYEVVVFLNTTGDVLDEAQQAAFERFIRARRGFVGVHSASNTEEGWPWYRGLVGRMFHIHPEIQTAKLKVESRGFPGMERFPITGWFTDEWYEFGPAEAPGLNVLLSVDESTYSIHAKWGAKQAVGMGAGHPISWYHTYDGGRSFYTALGHLPAAYSEDLFLQHLYGGIYWAATGRGAQRVE